ncbi:MAG: hypothetical protein NTW12_07320 [Deltaproteobacteria bacterium]|nr:hypothetical protein [Deltaproteobacteria bacterium]
MQSTKRQDTLSIVPRGIQKFLTAFAVILFAFTICPRTDAYADPVQLTIVQSSNMNGHLFPCPT